MGVRLSSQASSAGSINMAPTTLCVNCVCVLADVGTGAID